MHPNYDRFKKEKLPPDHQLEQSAISAIETRVELMFWTGPAEASIGTMHETLVREFGQSDIIAYRQKVLRDLS